MSRTPLQVTRLRQFWRRYIVGISWGFRGEKDAWGFFSNPSNSRRFPHECGDSGQSRRFPHAFICVASRVFKLASRVVVRRHAESETPPPRARAARCPRHPLSRGDGIPIRRMSSPPAALRRSDLGQAAGSVPSEVKLLRTRPSSGSTSGASATSPLS